MEEERQIKTYKGLFVMRDLGGLKNWDAMCSRAQKY